MSFHGEQFFSSSFFNFEKQIFIINKVPCQISTLYNKIIWRLRSEQILTMSVGLEAILKHTIDLDQKWLSWKRLEIKIQVLSI